MNKEELDKNFDLIEILRVLRILNQQKYFILVTFLTLAIVCSSYIFSIKAPTPIYKGSQMIEIGRDYKAENYIDIPHDLRYVVNKLFPVKVNPLPSGHRIFTIESTNPDTEVIKSNIAKATNFIITRHNKRFEKSDHFIMSNIIGQIEISANPINNPNKKKRLIKLLFLSLFLSIIIGLLRHSVQKMKTLE